MQIAIEGCCHGELDKIYGALQRLEEKENIKIDLLICCGDFQVRLGSLPARISARAHCFVSWCTWPNAGGQAIRNEDDLECISMPVKYREMGTFYKVRASEPSTCTRKASVQ